MANTDFDDRGVDSPSRPKKCHGCRPFYRRWCATVPVRAKIAWQRRRCLRYHPTWCRPIPADCPKIYFDGLQCAACRQSYAILSRLRRRSATTTGRGKPSEAVVEKLVAAGHDRRRQSARFSMAINRRPSLANVATNPVARRARCRVGACAGASRAIALAYMANQTCRPRWK
jgi:hypothetical protein